MKVKQFLKALALVLSVVLAFTCVFVPLTSVVSLFADDAVVQTYEQVKSAGNACGSRQPFKNYVLKSGRTNLITDSAVTDETYWSGDDYVTVDSTTGHSDQTSLKVSSGADFTKTVSVQSNTEYFLSVWGMCKSTAVSLANFGIADASTGVKFSNYLPENANTTDEYTWTDLVTIQCQDGTWYRRIYKFYTGDKTSVKLFIKNLPDEYCTKPGPMFLDDISIFKVSDAEYVETAVSDVTVSETTALDCTKANNLLKNGDFSVGDYFWDTPGFTENVEVAQTDTNRMLHFVSKDTKTYYLPNIELTSEDSVNGKEYTFSFWAKKVAGTASSSGSCHTKFGIVALNNFNSSTERGFISAQNYINGSGDWTQYGVTFKVYGPTDIAFAIYDDGGNCEALFDNFKLFESSNATTLTDVNSSKPIGGQYITACESNLGTTLTGSLLASVGGKRESDGKVLATDANKLAYPGNAGKQTTYYGGNNANMRAYSTSGVNVSKFGDNIIVDPTVGEVFPDDYATAAVRGTYRAYYKEKSKSELNVTANGGANALWDKPSDYTSGYEAYFKASDGKPVSADENGYVNNWKTTVSTSQNGRSSASNPKFISAKHSGYVSVDPADSHTPDGSGALKVKNTSDTKCAQIIPLNVSSTQIKKGAYYYFSFWMKCDESYSGSAISLDREVGLIASYTRWNETSDTYVKINFNTAYVTTFLDGNDNRNQWIKYSGIYCSGTHASAAYHDLFLRVSNDRSATYYFDDFELYELPDAYGKACYDAGYMLNTPLDTLGSTMKVKSLGNNETYQSTDWSALGETVYTDSSVADFTEDGYGIYYDEDSVANPEAVTDWSKRQVTDWKAFWDKPVVAYHNSTEGNVLCKSPANKGLLYSADDIADDEDLIAPRSNDGTGYIKLEDEDGLGKFHLPLPTLNSYTYYTVSFWVNNVGGTGDSQLFKTGIDSENSMPNSYYVLPADEGWTRINYVIYTGSTKCSEPSIRFDKVTLLYVDDIEVVKHTDTTTATNIMDSARPIGDVNADSIVNAVDLSIMVGALLGREYELSLLDTDFEYFDINSDTVFNLIDLIAVKKLLSK